MSSPLMFTSGFALNDDTAIAAGAGDSLPTFAKFTRIVEYSDSIDPHWWRHDQEWRASSISYFGPASEPEFDDFVVLSEEGNVRYVGDHAPSEEKIPNAGVFCEDAKGWGYLSDIQQVGERLYVCGYSGQVYRRNGPNNWTSIDGGLRQPPEGSTPEKLVRISLEVINGSDESAIYAAGYRHHNWLPLRLLLQRQRMASA